MECGFDSCGRARMSAPRFPSKAPEADEICNRRKFHARCVAVFFLLDPTCVSLRTPRNNFLLSITCDCQGRMLFEKSMIHELISASRFLSFRLSHHELQAASCLRQRTRPFKFKSPTAATTTTNTNTTYMPLSVYQCLSASSR